MTTTMRIPQTMKNMLLLLAVMLLCMQCSLLFARSRSGYVISGQVKESSSQPVSFATLRLLRADSTLVTGALVDEQGFFRLSAQLESGDYLLQVTAVGYQPEVRKLALQPGAPELALGEILIAPETRVLEEVSVRASRPMVERQFDKLVVNVQGSPLATSGTALETLDKSPGIWIDQDGNINLNGRTDVRVMIDGKLTYLSAKDLTNLLRSTPSQNIDKVEIITNPSAKYDASGSGGIINIVFRKNINMGLNGNVYTRASYNTKQAGGAIGTNLNFRRNRLSANTQIDLGRNTHFQELSLLRRFQQDGQRSTFDQTSKMQWAGTSPSVRLGLDYDLTDKQRIGVLYAHNSTRGTGANDNSTLLTYEGLPALGQDIFTRSDASERFRKNSVNLNYEIAIDTLSKLSADVDYSQIYSHDFMPYYTRRLGLQDQHPIGTEGMRNDMASDIEILTAKTDYERKLGKWGLQLGGKYGRVFTDNILAVETQENDGPWQGDAGRSNRFQYEEAVSAGYLNLNRQFGKVGLQAGLRAEHTHSVGTSVTTEQITERNYLDFFPSAALQFQAHQDHILSLSYSRRIDRPNYGQLNPFRYYLDPYTSQVGNPYLNPQYIDALETSYTLKGKYNFSVRYADTQDMMGEMMMQNDQDKTTTVTQYNYGSMKSWTMTAALPFTLAKGWETNTVVSGFNNSYKAQLQDGLLDRSRFSVYVRHAHTFLLPAAAKLEAVFTYISPMVYGQYEIKSQYGIDLSVKKSFLKDKLDLSLAANDILWTRYFRADLNFANQDGYIENRHASRRFTLSATWKFNRGADVKVRQHSKGNAEEEQRAGGK